MTKHSKIADISSAPSARRKQRKPRTITYSNGDQYIPGPDDEEEYESPASPDTTLPSIFTHDKQLPALSSEVLTALLGANTPNPALFVQSGALVTIGIDESGKASIKGLDLDGLRGIIARAANFYDKPGKTRRGVNPPIEVVRDIASLRSWTFPPIKAVVSTPIIRPDGGVLDTPGYDAATQLYYQPAPGLVVEPVPDQPTQEDIRAALQAIDDIIYDFPYVSDADRANAFAAMLTPYVRMLVGCVPMAIFEAPKQGTGKSLHADILSIIQTGDEAEMTPVPTTEEEWTKTLAGLMRDGSTMIVFDNLVGILNSSVLASVLTSRVFRPRLLGKMTALELYNTATWLATANNVRLGGDFPRRCYPVRLDAKVVNPEKREGFLHPDLKPYAKRVRGKVIHALLTLARAWYAADRPMPKERVVMGSFDEWASTIAGILHFAGISGFLANVQLLHERADVETPLWEGFFTEWERIFGSREVLAADVAKEMDTLKVYLPDYLLKAYADKPDTFSRKLGNAFASQECVRYTEDGLRLERGGIAHKIQLWRVVRDLGGLETNPLKTPMTSTQEYSGTGGFDGFGGSVCSCLREDVENDSNRASIEVTVQNPPNPQTPLHDHDGGLSDDNALVTIESGIICKLGSGC